MRYLLDLWHQKSFLGGISELTYPSMVVMRAMFDFLIIETVGVGQSDLY